MHRGSGRGRLLGEIQETVRTVLKDEQVEAGHVSSGIEAAKLLVFQKLSIKTEVVKVLSLEMGSSICQVIMALLLLLAWMVNFLIVSSV